MMQKSLHFLHHGLMVPVILACALFFGVLHPAAAFADVRKADVVCGETVETRGLSVAQCPNVDAEYVCVMDKEGNIYFERNSGTPTQIASITKIMTAIVALEAVGQDAGNVTIPISEAAATVGESSAGLKEGDVLSFDSAIKALMVPSGNDAAIALAEALGDRCQSSNDSLKGYDRFVQAMNDKAREIGCADTVFTNPHGLDFDEWAGDLHSTASDVAKITQYAMRNETFRQIVAGGSTVIPVKHADGEQGEITLQTTDQFLEMYEYACGVKTGITELAGPSFVGASNKDGFELYVVVIRSSSEGQRFNDTVSLCEWVYEHQIMYPLANSDETAMMPIEGATVDVPVVAHVSHQDWMDKTVAATLSDPQAAVSIFDLNGNISQTVTFEDLSGNIHYGDKVGHVEFRQRNTVVAEYDLIACEEVFAPNFFEGVKIWWSRLFNGLGSDGDAAESVTVNQLPYVIDKTSAE